VRDQGDGQLVDSGIAGQIAGRQLGQLAVIAARETLPDLSDVFLDDVVVVQQPLARGTDVLAGVGRGGEPRVGIPQNPAGAVEARQERSPPPPATLGAGQALLRGQGLGPLTEVFGTQQLAADRPREQIFACLRTTRDETGEEAARIQRRDGGTLWVLAGGSAPGNSRDWSSRRGSGVSAGRSW
jgi:hypothetical protein